MLNFLLTLMDDESVRDVILRIYDTYHGDMIRFARNRIRKAGLPNVESDSEDVVQNAFVKMCKYGSSIESCFSEKQLKNYVFSIVANECRDIVNSYRHFEDVDEYVETLADEEFFERLCIGERYDEVIDLVKQLDEKYSITLLFYYYDEMSVKEIAGCLGISEKTVYTRLARGKQILLKFVEKED